jgi:hypothetical protein
VREKSRLAEAEVVRAVDEGRRDYERVEILAGERFSVKKNTEHKPN